MFRVWFLIVFGFLPVRGAERLIEFTTMKTNEPPAGLRPALMGQGRPPEWKIIQTEVPPVLDAVTAKAETPRQNVLAQVSRDPTEYHYPLLILDDQDYANFTITTRFKLEAGVVEQMAGIAFRMQNESNYFYIRASGLYGTVRFSPVVNGIIQNPVGADLPIASGVWHEFKIGANGNQITCWLDGKQAFPTAQDSTYSAGKIAFWTKSDSVSYFTDTRIVYQPREALANILIRETMPKHPRLKNIRIVAKKTNASSAPQVIASAIESEIGQAANEYEADAIANDKKFAGKDKEKGILITTWPLHDKNGEAVAAVRFELNPFPGQTEKNLLERTGPIIREMEARLAASKELTGLQ